MERHTPEYSRDNGLLHIDIEYGVCVPQFANILLSWNGVTSPAVGPETEYIKHEAARKLWHVKRTQLHNVVSAYGAGILLQI